MTKQKPDVPKKPGEGVLEEIAKSIGHATGTVASWAGVSGAEPESKAAGKKASTKKPTKKTAQPVKAAPKKAAKKATKKAAPKR